MKKIILSMIFLLAAFVAMGQDEAVTVDAEGNVGIGTNAPTAKLEVEGDLQVNGDINVSGDIKPVGQDYSDWYVGNYYSIPADERTQDWDLHIANLSTDWTTYDFSEKIPPGTKRIKVFIHAYGVGGDGGLLEEFLIQARPFGSTSTEWSRTGLILYRVGKSGDAVEARFACELEIDVVDGKFQLKDYGGTWNVGICQMNLRGFYR